MSNGLPEAVTGAFADLSEQRLEFGEGLLDRIEVGAVGWQVEQPGLAAFDGLLNAGDLVAGQIIHDDNIARPQRRGENLFDISPEDVTVHGAIEDIRGGDAGGAQTGDKSGGFAVTVGAPGPAGADRGRIGQSAGSCWLSPRSRRGTPDAPGRERAGAG